MSARASLLLLLLAAPAPASAADLFSPGELSEAHKHLEGLANCKQCHGDGEQVSQSKCLDCHQELQGPVAKGEGFHGRIPEGERGCQSCHHEHQGRGFALIEWLPSKKGFAHERTGWPLEGAHRKADCDGCHQPRLVLSPQLKELLARRPTTFLGLSRQCHSCHFDEHRGQLEGDCARCHRAEEWKPAPGFDHRKTAYPLTGKHRSVKCAECHREEEDVSTPADAFPAPKDRTFLEFAGVRHESCLDCHRDPHDGRFGQRCESCHTTAGWEKVKTPGGAQGGAFHDRTRFPLLGAHRGVECRSCHGPFPGQKAKFKGLAFGACTDCHADAHLGQLSERGAPIDCARCHSVESFSPPRFELADHARTGFALEGAHQAVACGRCHPHERSLADRFPAAVARLLTRQKRPVTMNLSRFELGKRAPSCQSCHADPHAGQFAARVKAEGCRGCHSVETFTPAKFDHAKDSRFPLVGAHLTTACASCHPSQKLGGQQAIRYRPLETACASCHADPHLGQFGEAGCDRCHDPARFSPTKFEHRPPFTRFLLDGRHAAVECAACHPAVALGGGKKAVRYQGLPTTCEGCHTDFHRGAFKGFTP